jgi:hypothetical protein
MFNKNFKFLFFAAILILVFQGVSYCQSEVKKKKHKTGAFYFSWGYNTEWYTTSTVHVQQDALGNSYDLQQVKAHDHKGWDDGIFNKALTIPQYNYRIGYYFNKKQDLGVEINFDHTKYIIADGQTIQVTGRQGNDLVNTSIVFSQANGFYYFLNNGANFFLFNIVKRLPLYNSRDNNLRIDLTGKAGTGPVVPHVENSFYGNENVPHFQLGGWNIGVESAIRFTIMKYAFLELSEKVDYARYSHLKIYQGLAKQNFGTIEFIGSLGFILPTHKHNPMFSAE